MIELYKSYLINEVGMREDVRLNQFCRGLYELHAKLCALDLNGFALIRKLGGIDAIMALAEKDYADLYLAETGGCITGMVSYLAESGFASTRQRPLAAAIMFLSTTTAVNPTLAKYVTEKGGWKNVINEMALIEVLRPLEGEIGV